MKNYDKDEIELLISLLEFNLIRYERAIDWGYKQYSLGVVPEWVELFVLESCCSGMIDVLRNEIGVQDYSEYSDQYVAEVAKLFVQGAIKERDISLLLRDYMEIDDQDGQTVYVKFSAVENGIDYKTEVFSNLLEHFKSLSHRAQNEYSEFIRT